ncbi:MAG: hypothetical protein KAI47_00160 [Deltaproteobacteria bacterium]|nr:hypothetical protein [Deltaproteobacteria bacterium]
MRRLTLVPVIAGLLFGCGADDTNYGKHGFTSETLKIMNAEGESAILRTGTALSVRATEQDLNLAPNTAYQVVVKDIETGVEVGKAQLLSDLNGELELTTVAHDIGEFDDVKNEDHIGITVSKASTGEVVADVSLQVTPHISDLVGRGFQVDEVQPAHVYTCAADSTVASGCKPLNSFVVGALPDPGEVGAPLYVAGEGFPASASEVDIYVVKDADKWQGKEIPKQGDAAHIAGPITATLDRGLLRPTKLTWLPSKKDVGPYDVLVDVDQNGRFDYLLSVKDAADGEDKVGVTIQLGAGWARAKASTTKAKLSIDAAQLAFNAANTAASEAEAIATGQDAKAKAAQARAEADTAKAKLADATTASAAASAELAKDLVDPSICGNQADRAEADAKDAAAAAAKAAQLVNDTKQAQAAFVAQQKALAAKNASKHYIVNLAFTSRSRKGTWSNHFTHASKIYSYVNPPMQSGGRHGWVSKVIVKHQSWSTFWNNPENIEPGGKGGAGRIPIQNLIIQGTGGKVQHSCTNSPPVVIVPPGTLPIDDGVDLLKFDIVFDYDGDGYYDIGRDMLDVVAHTTSGNVVSAKDLANLPDDQIYGFSVSK